MFTLIVVLFAVTLFLAVTRFAEGTLQTHPFSVEDMLAMDRISDVQASPDGTVLAFTRRVTDMEANKGRTDIWLVHPDGAGLRRLTSHEAGSSHPRWSHDGAHIYFLSGRSDSSQVWRIPIDGGEAEQVTHLPLDAESFALSPQGTHLAVSMEVFPDAESVADTKKRLDERAEQKASGRVYDQLMFRHWDTWKDGRRSHVFVLPVDGSAPPLDIQQGMDADSPSKPFGGAEEYSFTPDGKSVVFAARNVGREEAWSTHFNLYVAPADGSDPPKVVIDGQGAMVTNPVFSPDGKTLAYLMMARAGYEADRLRIALKDWPSGSTRVLTEKWDRSATSITWSRDNKTIFTAADDIGQRPLFAIDVATGQVTRLHGDGRVSDIATTDNRVVFGLRHFQSPVELHSVDGEGKDLQTLTQINAQKLAASRMGTAEQFSFKGWNDETVYGFVVKPVDFDETQKYPVAFLIHGGPQGSFGNDFHYRWNPQAYAGAGYAAILIDFHGSTGYGQDFTDAINNHWGDRPLEDLQKGLAYALDQYPWLDKSRVAALGASYGGYMVNWIHGVWNEPFRCLVCHDGNIDERMAYYDTEELWFPEWERGGTPWEKPDAYTEHNPIDHLDKWRLPTLVIHGQKDFRVVDTQGLSTFTALQRRGIPSRLLYFPNENHWVLKPHNSVQWHAEVIGWLDRWCKS